MISKRAHDLWTNRERVQRQSQPDPAIAEPFEGAAACAFLQPPAAARERAGGEQGGTVPAPAQHAAEVA
jgi:hypothetical protein